ncbi:MAG: potassium-transporting ATPase subunit KdpA [Chloroflexi bacterium]|uniref:Potassium-transporting ATPase potassium-binding subunit n=1 Tax=Candidatus Chlorohelix allophototropha TaxID=3003348 RepID=A0A8T7LUB9_9CHLR|nr:potassium-transporting ATPase subunit KdpA [Chloroflexota bacterium]WJW67487.1 potassium-transporting ATPase subunit KdpA [Chloroflexota bacterium L227-S17]
MTANGLLQIALYFLVILLITKPLGIYMFRVFSGERTFMHRVIRPLEAGIYKIARIDEKKEMNWIVYAIAMLLFSLVTMLLTYLVLRLQDVLPLNQTIDASGTKVGKMPEALAFNTAASFTTNTNWQNYVPEAGSYAASGAASAGSGVTYFTQLTQLAFHNFVSAAVGISIAVALIRGLVRRQARELGNFWVDVVRAVLYILLPLCILIALFYVWQGVPMNFNDYTVATTVEGQQQIIAQGPVASQEAIKMLGTNGGGFFNANSAHPFENPTPFTNFIQMLSIFAIGMGLLYAFGRWAGNTKQGWVLVGASMFLFGLGLFVCYVSEAQGNPIVATQGVNQSVADTNPGGNMEGKEIRFGIVDSALFTTITTDASCGAVNSFLDSYTPLGGLVPLTNIALGEIVVGGVGAGFYGKIVFVILAVFIAGLMVGRTPEYLGKKIEAREMKMVMLVVLILPLSILGFSMVASINNVAQNSIANPGPHGLTEMLYLFTSSTGNNGSAFAGITGNTDFYNITGSAAMLIGRFLMIVPILALAGAMARKRTVPASVGTFPTTGPLFAGLLIGVILIVGALTYFPAYSLGPLVEQFFMNAGKVFQLS